MPVEAFNGKGVMSKLEILRGDLVDVLYQATVDTADYRFDTRITALEQSDDAVQSTLSDGTRLRADLVVGADGPHSRCGAWCADPRKKSSNLFTTADAVDLPDYAISRA